MVIQLPETGGLDMVNAGEHVAAQELLFQSLDTLYAAWDAVKAVRAALEKLDGDRRVVNVICAVNEARRRDRALTDKD